MKKIYGMALGAALALAVPAEAYYLGVPDAEHATLTLLLYDASYEGDPTLTAARFSATVGGDGVYSVAVTPKADVFITKTEEEPS